MTSGNNVRPPDRVYLVRGPTGLIKIGVSCNPAARSRQLRGELLHTIRTRHAYWLERELHRQYAARRVKGEWFALTDDDLSALRKVRVRNPGVPFKPDGPQWYGPALRRLRRSYGMRQDQLAKLAGCSAGMIALWERTTALQFGGCHQPYPDQLAALASVFGVRPAFFLIPREQQAVEGRIRETPLRCREAA